MTSEQQPPVNNGHFWGPKGDSFLLSSGLDYEDEDEEEGDDSVFTSEEKAGESGKPTTGDATSELGKMLSETSVICFMMKINNTY
jgi:hypothetical protein